MRGAWQSRYIGVFPEGETGGSAGNRPIPAEAFALCSPRLKMPTLPILHFNDVYRVQPFKLVPSSTETIDVTQWAAMLDDIRDTWTERIDGKHEGLVLFSGDVFSPSTESSVTRGSHMVSENMFVGVSSLTRIPGPSNE